MASRRQSRPDFYLVTGASADGAPFMALVQRMGALGFGLVTGADIAPGDSVDMEVVISKAHVTAYLKGCTPEDLTDARARLCQDA